MCLWSGTGVVGTTINSGKRRKRNVTELKDYYHTRTATGKYDQIFTVEYKNIGQTYDNISLQVNWYK